MSFTDDVITEAVRVTQREFDSLASRLQQNMKQAITSDNKGYQTGKLSGAIDKRKVNQTTYEVGILNEAPFMKNGANYARIYANGRGAIYKDSGYMVFRTPDGRIVRTRSAKGQSGNDFVGTAIKNFR